MRIALQQIHGSLMRFLSILLTVLLGLLCGFLDLTGLFILLSGKRQDKDADESHRGDDPYVDRGQTDFPEAFVVFLLRLRLWHLLAGLLFCLLLRVFFLLFQTLFSVLLTLSIR